jgi:hypothetical protein
MPARAPKGHPSLNLERWRVVVTYFEDGPAEGVLEDQPEEQHTEEHAQPRPVGVRLNDFRERIKGALTNLEPHPMPAQEGEYDVVGEVSGAEHDAGFRGEPQPSEDTAFFEEDELSRFPLARAGYSRAAVDAELAALEKQIEALKGAKPSMSIQEEIERLGEQTASILIVAHNEAQETTRQAQEQADRCIADAASNAVSMTEKAKRDLAEIDNETDAVWRERARLIDDARTVGTALIALADEAAERFPPEHKAAEDSPLSS